MDHKKQNSVFKNDMLNALSKNQVQEFFESGYIIIEKLFTEQQLEQIKSSLAVAYQHAVKYVEAEFNSGNLGPRYELEKDYDNSSSVLISTNMDGTTPIKLISWVGGIQPELVSLGRDAKITVPVAQLLGATEICHLINQGHYKTPNDQIQFDWHQDIQNRRSFDAQWEDKNGKGSFVQVLTAVDKTTPTNGPLILIPNSHRKDLELEKCKDSSEIDFILQREYPELDKIKQTLSNLNPGDTIFMHPLLLHKSDPNTSNDHGETRTIFINGYSYPGANHKPYPGKQSAQNISVNNVEFLVEETEAYASMILSQDLQQGTYNTENSFVNQSECDYMVPLGDLDVGDAAHDI